MNRRYGNDWQKQGFTSKSTMRTMTTIMNTDTDPSIRRTLIAALAKTLNREVTEAEEDKERPANTHMTTRAQTKRKRENEDEEEEEYGKSTFLMYCKREQLKEAKAMTL